jgi:hypothetical protein
MMKNLTHGPMGGNGRDWERSSIFGPDSWFARMDDPSHIRAGIANIPLPLAAGGENIVIFHSGWGDGLYPVISGYDASDLRVRVHIDFFVVPPSK